MSDLKLLDGVKVVDMSAFVAAPMAAEILAEYGADVVRIEPLTGDGIRGSGMTQNIYNGDAPLYDAINGNKRHIAVNTRTAEGMGVLWKLLETADIFICHMREKDMVKLGIDWDTLHAKFPALIYANTTGYGSTGPLASRGGFDMIAYATRTGLTTDVVPEGAHPYMPYQAQGDIPTGLYLSIGIMAAYINRLRTGLGDQVSCSLYGSGMMSAMVPILSGQKPYNNLWPKGRENVLPFSCMYRGSDDRWIMVAGLQWHKDWPRFVARLGLDPELVTKYPDYMTALAKSNEIIPMLDELFATKTVQEWSDILTEEDIPNDICLKFSEVADDPAVLTGNLMKEVEMPSGEVMRRKLWLSKMLRMETAVFLWLGTSMPTAGLPGMGASIRTSATARFRAISSASEVMRLIFTPARGCSSYRVTDGPRLISIIRVCTPKLDSVFTSRSALCVSSSSTPFSSVGCCLRKRLRGG